VISNFRLFFQQRAKVLYLFRLHIVCACDLTAGLPRAAITARGHLGLGGVRGQGAAGRVALCALLSAVLPERRPDDRAPRRLSCDIAFEKSNLGPGAASVWSTSRAPGVRSGCLDG
jgi:hypothetical protein